MNIMEPDLEGVLVIEPALHEDDRGFFMETWNADRYRQAGIHGDFVQDNVSRSKRGTIRGLHYQKPNPQGKLVTVLSGRVWDVLVDLRVDSVTFRQWLGIELSGQNRRQLWVPVGFAHGFQALSEEAIVHYKCTARYSPADQCSVRWNDPTLAIEWPISKSPLLSTKDAAAPLMENVSRSSFFEGTLESPSYRS